MNFRTFLIISFFVSMMIIPEAIMAQLSAPGASGADITSYPVFNEPDSIFVFCVAESGIQNARLEASAKQTGTKTYLWEKYNPLTAQFDFYFSESTDAPKSTIENLSNGCYRSTITQGENSVISRAWVFNNWYNASASIPESNCDFFVLASENSSAPLIYFDLTSNAEVQVNKNVKVQWKKGSDVIAAVSNAQVFNPPTANTEYTFRVYDKFSCEATATITYESIVTKAKFDIDKQNGEAPLTVAFTNTSENGTPGQYEWFFFYDLDWIKENAGGFTSPADSIEIVAYDDNPVYTYEYSGAYMVKLVSKKITGSNVCVDTVYLKDYIIADTSFVAVPNVFTPNGDGTNDEFVVKFWSMQNIEISIFNRWGRKVHYWKSDNIRGFEGIYTETVWDGRLMGGRYASPGVYYYVVAGEGRDGETRRKRGFFHLFRDKD